MGSLVPAGASEATLRAETRLPVSEGVSAFFALMTIYLGKKVLFGHQPFEMKERISTLVAQVPSKGIIGFSEQIPSPLASSPSYSK